MTQWISVDERLPEERRPVLAFDGEEMVVCVCLHWMTPTWERPNDHSEYEDW